MPSEPPAVCRLFVYGTLMPGRLRWPLLEPYAVSTRCADVPGALYDSGNGWPVAVFGEGVGTVPGVIVELDPDRIDEVLPILDDIEDTATGLLRRIVVTATATAPAPAPATDTARAPATDMERAWAYHWPHDLAGMKRIDGWDHQEDR